MYILAIDVDFEFIFSFNFLNLSLLIRILKQKLVGDFHLKYFMVLGYHLRLALTFSMFLDDFRAKLVLLRI